MNQTTLFWVTCSLWFRCSVEPMFMSLSITRSTVSSAYRYISSLQETD